MGEAKLLSGEIEAPRSDPDALPLPEDLIEVELTLHAWLDPSMTAYSSQICYIKHGSIRDNILNGLPMWHERYAAVLRQCALFPDLRLFDHADLTEVGEQGVTLVSDDIHNGALFASLTYLFLSRAEVSVLGTAFSLSAGSSQITFSCLHQNIPCALHILESENDIS